MTVKDLRDAILSYPLDCTIVVKYEPHQPRMIMELNLTQHKAFNYKESMEGDYRTHEDELRVYVYAQPRVA